MSVVDAFVNELDLADLGWEGVQAAKTGRPSFHPMVPLAIHVDGDLDRVHLSRRLGREYQRNPEWMWLTGRPAPDLKTIADFRRDREKAFTPWAESRFRRSSPIIAAHEVAGPVDVLPAVECLL